MLPQRHAPAGDVTRHRGLAYAKPGRELGLRDCLQSEEVSELHGAMNTSLVLSAQGPLTEMVLAHPLSGKYRNGMSTLATLREARGLNQTQLAKALGTQAPQINRWENGTRQIPLRWAVALSAYFSVSIKVFLPQVDLSEEGSIDNLLRQQPPEVKERAYRAVLEVVLKA